jgi:hypothetical protein
VNAARVLALPVALALAYAGVATGALPLPVSLRLLAALGGLLWLPGLALTRIAQRPPGGNLLVAGWALGMGAAWNGALLLGVRLLHADFRALVWLSPVLAVVLWLLALRRSAAAEEDEARWSRWSRLALVVAVGLAVLHGARLGTPAGYYTDSPDHIGTIRRMMASGDMFPQDAFFADAGQQGADPRKGLWHPQVALVCLAARADPYDGWVGLATWLGPVLLLNMAALGFLAGGAGVAALAAWVLLFTLGGSLAEQYFREAVYATRMGDSLALAAGTALAYDLARPSAGRRAAAVLLALGAVFTHVFSALQFALVFGALGVSLAARRADRGRLPRWLGTSALAGLACLPYLIYRAGQAYAPRNIIHTLPQGLLYLNDRTRVVSIGVMWDWLGLLWIALPFLLVWVARQAPGRPALHLLLVSGTAPLVVMFTPPVVEWLQPSLGYLLMRMVWMVPLAALVALAAFALVRALRAGPAMSRARAALLTAALAALAWPSAADSVRVLLHPAGFAQEERAHSPRLWFDALAWMDRHLPPGTVVLTDPATSYSIPMMTRHYVVSLVDQHSSPNDSRALDRLLDARDALDPHGSWARTLQVLRDYRVDAIALNGRFIRPLWLDYWAPYPGFLERVRARFDRYPERFPVLYDSAGFVVYGVRQPLPDSLPETAGEPPWLVARLPATALAVSDTVQAGARLVAVDFEHPAGPVPALAPGDTLWASAYWRPERREARGSYMVFVRFDRADFGPPRWLAWAAKPYRKLVEARRGERYRFRQDHLPGEGQFNVDRWPAGRLVRDPFAVTVPPDIAPGLYRMRLRMSVSGHYPNYRLSDYLSDEDYYSGVEVARVRIVPRKGP